MSGEVAPSRCRSCGAAIRWVVMAGTQRRMPVDYERHDEGTVKITPKGTHTSGVVLSRADAARLRAERPDDAPLHRSHFTTCPSRDAHRQVPTSGAPADQGEQMGLL